MVLLDAQIAYFGFFSVLYFMRCSFAMQRGGLERRGRLRLRLRAGLLLPVEVLVRPRRAERVLRAEGLQTLF